MTNLTKTNSVCFRKIEAVEESMIHFFGLAENVRTKEIGLLYCAHEHLVDEELMEKAKWIMSCHLKNRVWGHKSPFRGGNEGSIIKFNIKGDCIYGTLKDPEKIFAKRRCQVEARKRRDLAMKGVGELSSYQKKRQKEPTKWHMLKDLKYNAFRHQVRQFCRQHKGVRKELLVAMIYKTVERGKLYERYKDFIQYEVYQLF